jgi:hypothetical protein
MDLREIDLGDMAWINLAEDKDQWRALVYREMTFLDSITGNYLSS